MKFEEWLKIGINSGFCGAPVCSTHDGTPTSGWEDQDFLDDYDPCITVLRLYENDDVKREVEDNHPPSRWRIPSLLWLLRK